MKTITLETGKIITIKTPSGNIVIQACIPTEYDGMANVPVEGTRTWVAGYNPETLKKLFDDIKIDVRK